MTRLPTLALFTLALPLAACEVTGACINTPENNADEHEYCMEVRGTAASVENPNTCWEFDPDVSCADAGYAYECDAWWTLDAAGCDALRGE